MVLMSGLFAWEKVVGGFSLLIQEASFKIDLHPYDTESCSFCMLKKETLLKPTHARSKSTRHSTNDLFP